MPQLDVSTYISQIFWLVIIFSLLVLFVKYFFCNDIEEVLNRRESVVKSNLTETEKMLSEYREIEKKISKLLTDTRNIAVEKKNKSTLQAKVIASDILKNEEAQLQQKMFKERGNLAKLEKNIRQELNNSSKDFKDQIKGLVLTTLK